ncbi:MAG: alpha/beta hydrolase [Flavobacteriaceae bacterium]|nr:alpha/beta hydrolase [Flavobacteriaceae bacterium]
MQANDHRIDQKVNILMRRLKKILKVVVFIILILILGILIAAHLMLKPKSDDKVLEKLDNAFHKPFISHNKYKNFEYRVIAMQKVIDSTLPTLVFVHGSPGSPLDFARYFKDSLLNNKSNILGYERVGYGLMNAGNIQGSIKSELEILHDVIKNIPSERIVLIGYSYGGTIVLASPKNYKFKVSLASAISADLEPMFWILNLYKWSITRPLIPKIVQAAAKEKYAHLTDLPKYETLWTISESPVINIQGDKDWIVPYENSLILEPKFRDKDFKMVTIQGGGHALIWSDFDLIKNEILWTLD